MEKIGTISRHPSRPERLALLRLDGTVSNWFGMDETIDTIRPQLEALGASVDADGVVSR